MGFLQLDGSASGLPGASIDAGGIESPAHDVARIQRRANRPLCKSSASGVESLLGYAVELAGATPNADERSAELALR